jgi:YggT family protein
MFFNNLMNFLASLVQLYSTLLFIRIILSWVPSLDWYRQPQRFLKDVTDPALNLARRVIPPLGMLDLSPIVVFLALSILRSVLQSLGG